MAGYLMAGGPLGFGNLVGSLYQKAAPIVSNVVRESLKGAVKEYMPELANDAGEVKTKRRKLKICMRKLKKANRARGNKTKNESSLRKRTNQKKKYSGIKKLKLKRRLHKSRKSKRDIPDAF